MAMDVKIDTGPAAESPPETDELIDTLIAVSVVAKRLAEKLRKQKDKEE